MKLKAWRYGPQHDQSGKIGGYTFWCPGCKKIHQYYTYAPGTGVWEFNENLASPTFTPSLLMYRTEVSPRCHLFVTNGQIIFCGDCEHWLKGEAVDMVDLPKEWE